MKVSYQKEILVYLDTQDEANFIFDHFKSFPVIKKRNNLISIFIKNNVCIKKAKQSLKFLTFKEFDLTLEPLPPQNMNSISAGCFIISRKSCSSSKNIL